MAQRTKRSVESLPQARPLLLAQKALWGHMPHAGMGSLQKHPRRRAGRSSSFCPLQASSLPPLHPPVEPSMKAASQLPDHSTDVWGTGLEHNHAILGARKPSLNFPACSVPSLVSLFHGVSFLRSSSGGNRGIIASALHSVHCTCTVLSPFQDEIFPTTRDGNSVMPILQILKWRHTDIK